MAAYDSARSGRVVLTGRIARDTDFTSRRLIVTVNGVDRRIDVPKDVPISQAGFRASVHDLRKGDIIRVVGVRTDANRYRAQRIDVLHTYGVDDPVRERLSSSDRYDDRDLSYDTREDYTRTRTVDRYTGTGVVQRVRPDDGTFDIRVGSGIRTVVVSDARLNGFRRLDQLRRGDRVHVIGELDGRDVDAEEVRLLD